MSRLFCKQFLFCFSTFVFPCGFTLFSSFSSRISVAIIPIFSRALSWKVLLYSPFWLISFGGKSALATGMVAARGGAGVLPTEPGRTPHQSPSGRFMIDLLLLPVVPACISVIVFADFLALHIQWQGWTFSTSAAASAGLP